MGHWSFLRVTQRTSILLQQAGQKSKEHQENEKEVSKVLGNFEHGSFSTVPLNTFYASRIHFQQILATGTESQPVAFLLF